MSGCDRKRLFFYFKALLIGWALSFFSVGPAAAFDCEQGYAHNKAKKCVPCGHKDQPSCEPLRKGPQCFDDLQKIDGICVVRGGEGQLTYSGLGFDCRPGFNKDPKDKRKCTACGELKQPSCEPMRKGARCNTGLKPKFTALNVETCIPDPESVLIKKVQDDAKKMLKEYLADIVQMILRARNGSQDSLQVSEVRVAVHNLEQSSKKTGKNGDRVTMTTEQVPDNTACEFGHFKSWSLGVGGDANALRGAGVESGLSIRCADHKPGQQDAKLYWSTSTSRQLGADASAGITVGMSKEPFDAIAGKTHGFTLSILAAADTIKALTVSTALTESLKNLQKLANATPGIAIGVWFERKNDGKVGKFQGISVSLTGGVGIDAGGTYVQESTHQF